MTEEQSQRWQEMRRLLRELETLEPGAGWRYVDQVVMGLRAAIQGRKALAGQRAAQDAVWD